MKYLLTIISIIGVSSHAYCQQAGTSDFSPRQLGSKFIQLGSNVQCPDNIKFPFSNIRVTDIRFDTSKIGFIPSKALVGLNAKLFQKLVFKNGTANSIQGFFNKYYSKAFSSNQFGLHIFIKTFWLSSTRESTSQANAVSVDFATKAKLHVKWELYLFRNDEYLPFRRIDTVLEFGRSARELLISHDVSADVSSPFMNIILTNMLEQFTYEKIAAVFDSKTKKNLLEIKSMNEQRFFLPVLTNPQTKEGLFMSFDEFKKNEPSITDIKVQRIRYRASGITDYSINDNDPSVRNFWAYHYKGFTRTNLFGNDKMFRCGNTFEYFLKIRVAETNARTVFTALDDNTIWIPYQIDMETGNSY